MAHFLSLLRSLVNRALQGECTIAANGRYFHAMVAQVLFFGYLTGHTLIGEQCHGNRKPRPYPPAQSGWCWCRQRHASVVCWILRVRYGVVERTLISRSQQVRQFKKLETLVGYLKKVGIVHFEVDASRFSAESMSRITRPDRSAAMKRIHEAAYEAGLKEKASLDDEKVVGHVDEWKAESPEE